MLYEVITGSWGGNSISENVGPKHLINKKIVAKRAENMLWHKLPKSIYFRRGSLPIALSDLEGKKRAFLVTDRFLFNNGYADEIVNMSNEIQSKFLRAIQENEIRPLGSTKA